MADIKIKKEFRIICNMGLYDQPRGGGWFNVDTGFVVYDDNLDKACRKMSKELAEARCFRSGCTIEYIERIYYKDNVFDVNPPIDIYQEITCNTIFKEKIFRTLYYNEIVDISIKKEKMEQQEADVAEYLRLKERLMEWRILNEL